jgi:hypothetical protein
LVNKFSSFLKMLNPQRVPGKEQKAFEKRGNLLFHGSFKVSTAGFAGSGFFMLYVLVAFAAASVSVLVPSMVRGLVYPFDKKSCVNREHLGLQKEKHNTPQSKYLLCQWIMLPPFLKGGAMYLP